jgi:HEAT repeat protein
MRAVIATLAVTGAIALATGMSDDADFTLSPIDQIPTKDQINNALKSSDPLGALTARATNDQVDVGIRLRAIHALAKYCSSSPCSSTDVAHQSVVAVVDTITSKQGRTGAEVLLLRAAIETLGAMRVSSDASTLVPLLSDPSRDIRAATARALRDLCNSQAILPLRARYSAEMTDQVKLAISEALRILGQCSTP